MVRLGDGSSLQLPHGWTGADGGPCTALIGHSLLCLGGLRKLLNLVKALREPTVPEVVLNGEKIRPLQGSVGAEQRWLDLFEEDLERPWEGFPEAARADQPKKLERLCRYISRPAVSKKRLSLTANGNVRYQLKRPYRDGTTHVIFGPLDFSKRRASMRRAQRLKRVIDIETCRACGGAVWIIACIEESEVIEKILTHLDKRDASAATARLPTCRAPPQARLSEPGPPGQHPHRLRRRALRLRWHSAQSQESSSNWRNCTISTHPQGLILADTVPKRGLATVG